MDGEKNTYHIVGSNIYGTWYGFAACSATRIKKIDPTNKAGYT
jgi:hypothetical protein